MLGPYLAGGDVDPHGAGPNASHRFGESDIFLGLILGVIGRRPRPLDLVGELVGASALLGALRQSYVNTAAGDREPAAATYLSM